MAVLSVGEIFPPRLGEDDDVVLGMVPVPEVDEGDGDTERSTT